METTLTLRQENALSASQLSAPLFHRWAVSLDGVSENTKRSYARSIKSFMVYLAETGIQNPQKRDIISYKESLLAAGKKPSTVNAYLIAVKSFFKWAEEEGLYPDVSRNVKAVKTDKKSNKAYLSQKQVKRIISSVDTGSLKGKRDKAMLMLMVTTGVRTTEVMNANIEDMKLQGDEFVLYVLGKGRTTKGEYVKLSSMTKQAIDEYLEARGKCSGSEPLFCSVSDN